MARQRDDFHIVMEAKIGTNSLDYMQLRCYAGDLAASAAQIKRLIAITQIEEARNFDVCLSQIEPKFLPKGSCCKLRWHQVLRLLRESTGLTDNEEPKITRSILRGSSVDYRKRLAMLFLEEVEQRMYDRVVVNEVRAGEIKDIRVTVQEPKFMRLALRHHVWFPASSLQFGLETSRWVAFYETKGCDHPSSISYVARNLTFWNRVTLDDAKSLPELSHLFADRQADREISSWYEPLDTFHIVLTDKPVRLKSPILLAGSRRAKFLNKRLISMERFLNASVVDDLF